MFQVIEREVAHVNGAVAEVEKAIRDSTDLSRFPALLGTLLEKVATMENRTREAVQAEERAANSCKRRIEHLRWEEEHLAWLP